MADELFPSLKTLRRSQKEGFDLFADLSAPSKKDELTLRQYLMMIEAKKRAKKHLSFGDIVKGMGKGFVGGANWLLDKLMRPSFAVTAAASEAIGGKSDTPASNILEAAAMGFTGKIRKGWGEILHEQGVGGGKALRGVLGFTLDVATDPIMYLSLGTAAPAKGAIKEVLAAKNAGKVIPKELVRKAVSEASEQMLTHGKVEPFFKEIFEMGGKEAKHRLAYFDFMQKKGLRALEMPKPELRALSSMKAILGRGAIEESRTFDKRYMVVKLGTLKHNLVLPIMPIISRPGKLLVQRNVPILSQLADKTGKAFNPTWDETTIKSMRFTRDRVAEYNAQVQVKEISKILEGVGNKLSVEDQLKALHYMEKPLKKNKDEVWKAVIKEGSTYRLNPAYLSHLRQRNLINDVQEDFIERYFDATEELWRNDKAAGINVQHFGETGRMYVPHVVVSAP
ncbi:MAG: hypothetical protein QXH91_09505, partial [Candidatus Bathyarchaeia archaeon]